MVVLSEPGGLFRFEEQIVMREIDYGDDYWFSTFASGLYDSAGDAELKRSHPGGTTQKGTSSSSADRAIL